MPNLHMMATIEESIEELLNEIPTPSTLRTVVQNILYEPIPDAVKKRLLKPLLPRIAAPLPTPRERKLEKQKALLQEFDPLHPFTKRKLGVNRSELQPELKLMTPPGFVLRKEVGMFKDYSASLPLGHRLQPDALTCLNAMGAMHHSADNKRAALAQRLEILTSFECRARKADH